MKFLRKLLAVIFSVIWLWLAFSYSKQSLCSCCFQNEYQLICYEKSPTIKLFLSSKDFSKSRHCHCTLCGILNPIENLFLKYFSNVLKKKNVLSLGQDILEGRISLPTKDKTTYLDNKSLSKFPPLFLLESSFLM